MKARWTTVVAGVMSLLIAGIGTARAASGGDAKASDMCAPDAATHMLACSYAGDAAAGIPPRKYWVFVPTGVADGHRPVVVYLHGCEQTAPDAAVGTRFNQLAARDNFIVVYPQQTNSSPASAPLADGNGIACWNWFLPQDQSRGSGEPAAIAAITEHVIAAQDGDRRRVFVDGASAGADMSVILAAAYPDVFAAGAAIAGCAYATCSDASGALSYREMGASARVVPLLVEQGTGDTVNPFPLGQGLAQSWLNVDDWADDGSLNGSIARTPASIDNVGFDQTPSPGSGNVCVYTTHYNYPCPGGVVGFQHTYPTTIEHFDDAAGRDVLDFWIVHGLEHAYPGGDPNGSYTDPLGPDITAAAWQFFMAHPLRCAGCH